MTNDDGLYDGSLSLITTDAGEIASDVYDSLSNHIQEPLFPGDERLIFAEALIYVLTSYNNNVQDAALQTMLRFARGEVLDAIGERLDVRRLPPEAARTTLRFSITEARTTTVSIPAGTKVTADTSIYFATDEDAVIPSGSLSVDVTAHCTEAGIVGNGYKPGKLAQLVDLIRFVSSVTNLTVSTGGDDGEPYTLDGDNRFRERIRLAPGKLSTAGSENSYIYWAKTADAGITDVAAFSDTETLTVERPVIDGHAYIGGDLIASEYGVTVEEDPDATWSYEDNLLDISLTGDAINLDSVHVTYTHRMDGRVRIVPLMEGGNVPDQTVIDAVYEACNARDVRPMTDVVTVEAPRQVEYDIELTYYGTMGSQAELTKAVEGQSGVIETYIRDQCAKLGRDIEPDILEAMIMRAGAVRVDMVQPERVALTDTEVAKFSGNLTVHYSLDTGARWDSWNSKV